MRALGRKLDKLVDTVLTADEGNGADGVPSGNVVADSSSMGAW